MGADISSASGKDLHDLGAPPPPVFSQVFILKVVKVLCFDTLLQVFILKGLTLDPDLCKCDALNRHSGEGRKQKTPARCWRYGIGRDFTQEALYAGNNLLSSPKKEDSSDFANRNAAHSDAAVGGIVCLPVTVEGEAGED